MSGETKRNPYDYWVDGWPFAREWVKNPEPPRGCPYDGAIVNEDGELVIPHHPIHNSTEK